MAIQLAGITDPPPPPPPGAPKRELDEPVTYWSDKLAGEVRRAVSRECGPWGTARSRDSDHERDALMQSLALWALEHPREVQGLVYEQRMATYRQVLRRHLIRDSRDWPDSLEDRAIFRTRGRTAAPRELDLDSSAQARRFREHERAQRPSPHTSDEVLIRRHRSDDGHVNWLEVAGDREREQDAGEQTPAAALIAGTDALARGMAAAIIGRLEDRPNPIRLTDREAESLTVALLVAESHDRRTPLRRGEDGQVSGGKRIGGIARVASATGMNVSRVRHLSAGGVKLLGVLISPRELVALRREIARYLYRVQEVSPATVAEVDRALGIGPLREAIDRAAHLGERSATGRQVATGSAREVLDYIGRIERILSAPASSFRTDGAAPLPARTPPAHRPIRPEWRDGDWASQPLCDLTRWLPGIRAGEPLAQPVPLEG